MRIGSIGQIPSKFDKQTVKSAKMGAILTGGSIVASQAFQWATRPEQMRNELLKNGGKIPYIKNLAIATALYTLIGAVLSASVSKIADKINPIEPPRAAN